MPLSVYGHPIEATLGLPPVPTMLSEDWWVSVDRIAEYEGQQWYQINEAMQLERYQPATLFAEEQRGDDIWHLIGADQWVEESNVSRVDVSPLTQDIEPGQKWMEVGLLEQTIAAYKDISIDIG